MCVRVSFVHTRGYALEEEEEEEEEEENKNRTNMCIVCADGSLLKADLQSIENVDNSKWLFSS